MTPSDESDLQPAVASNVLEVLVGMLGVDDVEILIELLDAFLEDASNLVDRLAPEWIANNNREVMIIAHSLKSTSATFCAERLSFLSDMLETELRVEKGELNVSDCIDQIQQEYVRVHAALEQERQKLVGRR